MHLTKILLLITISLFCFKANAQEQFEQLDSKKNKKEKKVKVEKPKIGFTRTNEIGLTTSNFKTFGINVKFGKNENLWRINTSNSSALLDTDIVPDDENNYYLIFDKGSNSFLSFGREKRVVINDKYEVKFGLDLNSQYKIRTLELESRNDDILQYNFDQNEIQDTLSFGVNLVLGAQYIHINKFVFGFEVLPGVNYNFIKNHYKKKFLDFNEVVTSFEDDKKLKRSITYNIADLPMSIYLNYRF